MQIVAKSILTIIKLLAYLSSMLRARESVKMARALNNLWSIPRVDTRRLRIDVICTKHFVLSLDVALEIFT